MRFSVFVLAFLSLLLPTVGVAEVSDKITLIPEQWIRALLLSSALFALGYFRWRIALFTLILPCLLLLGTYQLQHSDIGPGIVREQGIIYFVSMYIVDIFVLAMAVSGMWIGRRRHQNELASDAAR